jgi:hypothetical protein
LYGWCGNFLKFSVIFVWIVMWFWGPRRSSAVYCNIFILLSADILWLLKYGAGPLDCLYLTLCRCCIIAWFLLLVAVFVLDYMPILVIVDSCCWLLYKLSFLAVEGRLTPVCGIFVHAIYYSGAEMLMWYSVDHLWLECLAYGGLMYTGQVV